MSLTVWLTAGVWIAGAVLGWAGVAKVLRPEGATEALRLAGVGSRPGAARALGVVEVTIAVAVLAVGGPWAAGALALAYVGFALFAERHRRSPGASCGCFGDESAPMTRLHVVVDAVAAAVAAAAVAAPVDGVLTGGFAAPLTAILTIALVAVGAVGVRAMLTLLPDLHRLAHRHDREAAA